MAKNTLFDGDAYWNDSWVQELDGDEERLYHFYITSPNLDKSGVYKQPERLVEFYVHGLGMKRIREITEKFAKAKKVIRCGEWIIVPTSLKHQNYRNNQKIIASIIDYLKKIPDEVFEALRECDYPLDLNAIKPPKNVKTGNPFPTTDDTSPKTDDLSMTYPCSTDDLSPKTDDLSMTYPCSTDDLSPKTDEFNLIESNSTKFNSIESEFNINSIQDIRQETPETLSSHFIRRWQQNADVFNCIARLKQPKDWQAFWEQNTMTLEQTDLAIDNFIAGVKSGAVDRRFIPSSPDTFVLNGWLQRSAEPFKKQGKGQRIANDNVADDDIDKYFREA